MAILCASELARLLRAELPQAELIVINALAGGDSGRGLELHNAHGAIDEFRKAVTGRATSAKGAKWSDTFNGRPVTGEITGVGVSYVKVCLLAISCGYTHNLQHAIEVECYTVDESYLEYYTFARSHDAQFLK